MSKVFYDSGNVHVTDTLISLPGKSYSTANLTSVEKRVSKPSMTLPIILIIIGIVLFFASFADINACYSMLIIGILVGGVGIVIIVINKPTFYVILHSASTEFEAISSKDEKSIDAIVQAIREAIHYRG